MPEEYSLMHQAHSFRRVVVASVAASLLSVAALLFVQAVAISPEPAFARQPIAPDVALYAMPRGSEGEDESFIFYNAKSGGHLGVSQPQIPESLSTHRTQDQHGGD